MSNSKKYLSLDLKKNFKETQENMDLVLYNLYDCDKNIFLEPPKTKLIKLTDSELRKRKVALLRNLPQYKK